MALCSRARISDFARQARRLIHEFVFMRAPEVAAVRILSVVSNLAFLALVNRYAGPVVAGQFLAAYASILVISSVARMGAEQYLIASLPRTSDSDRGSHVVSLILAIVGVTVMLTTITAFVRSFWSLPGAFGSSWESFLLFWVTTLFLSLNWVGVGALRGIGRYLPSVLLETFVYLSVFVVTIISINSYRSLRSTDLIATLSFSLCISVALGAALTLRSGLRPALPRVARVLDSCRRSASYWFAASLSVLNAWLPTLLLAAFAAPQEVGVFTLSYRLAMILLFGLMILNPRYAYDYSRLSANNDIAALIALYRRNTLSQLPFLFVAMLLLAIASPAIFRLANIGASDAYHLLVVLAAGTFVSSACGPVVTASMATGHARLVSATMAVTVALSASVVFLLREDMSAMLLAQIVAATVASQNIILYFLWMSQQKKALAIINGS